jgi:hypothetical protein
MECGIHSMIRFYHVIHMKSFNCDKSQQPENLELSSLQTRDRQCAQLRVIELQSYGLGTGRQLHYWHKKLLNQLRDAKPVQHHASLRKMHVNF